MNPLPPRPAAWLAVGLGWIAGFVDAVGFLAYFRLFTGNMTGNSTILGISTAQQDWGEFWLRMVPLSTFVLGTALGHVMLELGQRRGSRRRFAWTAALQALLLVAFITLGTWFGPPESVARAPAWQLHLPVAVVAVAMGLQNATLTRANGLAIHTTYLTGMLSVLVEGLVQYGVSGRGRPGWHLAVVGGLWAAFVVGAACGALLLARWHLLALVLPVAGLLGVAALDLLRPIGAPVSGPGAARES
jgi:uncharacterized membrane protein YoaK (UPF0700 family)